MKREEEICKRYADELAAIAALDRRYYLNPSPALADRKDYAVVRLNWNTRVFGFTQSLLHSDNRICANFVVVDP